MAKATKSPLPKIVNGTAKKITTISTPAKKSSTAVKLTTKSGIDDQLKAIEKQAYTPIKYTDVIDPTLLGSQALSDMYGVTFDRKAIEDILNQANEAKYTGLYQAQDMNERKFYENLSDTQRTLADTMRAQQAEAVMSGANKGSQAANQLSAMLGMSQQSMSGITDLTQQRTLLATQKAADQAKAVADALSQSNSMSMELANLDKALNSNAIQQRAADLSYNANVNTTNEDYAKSLAQAREDLLANYYTNLGNQKVADINGDAMVKAYQNYGVNAAKLNASTYAPSAKSTSTKNSGSNGSTAKPAVKTTTAQPAKVPSATLLNYKNGSPLSTEGYLNAVDSTGYNKIKDMVDKARELAKKKSTATVKTPSTKNTAGSHGGGTIKKPTATPAKKNPSVDWLTNKPKPVTKKKNPSVDWLNN